MNQLISIALFLFLLNTCLAELEHPFKQCSPRTAGEILSASVNAPCVGGYCTFYKGTEAQLEFTFRLRRIAQTARVKILATVGTTTHDFTLSKHDVCKTLGCPLKGGVTYSYKNAMFVNPTYPSVRVDQMQYSLVDGKGRVIACVSLPVMITEKDPK